MLSYQSKIFLCYLQDILKDNGVLICPSYFRTASFPQTMLFEINNCIYSSLANITGLPSTHIPMGMDKNGLPIGFQVINKLISYFSNHIFRISIFVKFIFNFVSGNICS